MEYDGDKQTNLTMKVKRFNEYPASGYIPDDFTVGVSELYSMPFHPEMIAHRMNPPNPWNYKGGLSHPQYDIDLKMWEQGEKESMVLFEGWTGNEDDGICYNATYTGGVQHIGYYIDLPSYSLCGHFMDDECEYEKPKTVGDFVDNCSLSEIELRWTKEVIEKYFKNITA